MLVYDWSRDPLVFEDEGLRKKIAAEQLRALIRLRNFGVAGGIAGDKAVNKIVGDFLVDSGLYGAVSRSIGPSSYK